MFKFIDNFTDEAVQENVKDKMRSIAFERMKKAANKTKTDMIAKSAKKVNPKVVKIVNSKAEKIDGKVEVKDDNIGVKVIVDKPEEIKIAKQHKLFDIAWKKIPGLLDKS